MSCGRVVSVVPVKTPWEYRQSRYSTVGPSDLETFSILSVHCPLIRQRPYLWFSSFHTRPHSLCPLHCVLFTRRQRRSVEKWRYSGQVSQMSVGDLGHDGNLLVSITLPETGVFWGSGNLLCLEIIPLDMTPLFTYGLSVFPIRPNLAIWSFWFLRSWSSPTLRPLYRKWLLGITRHSRH